MTSITMCFALQTPATWVKAKTGDGSFSLVGEERHLWNVRTVKGKSLVSITRARLGKLETRLETVSYDFLFSLLACLGILNFHSRLYKSIETQNMLYFSIYL